MTSNYANQTVSFENSEWLSPCDEAKPECKNCIKRENTCSFSSAQSSLIVVGSSYTTTPSQTKVNETGPSAKHTTHENAPSEIEEVNLAKAYSLRGDYNDTFRLIHHYALSTCYSISDPASGPLLLRDAVPALAFEHDFLLSGLLAVTSLHLALIHPSTIHTKSAIKYHSEAVTLVRPHLTNITPHNVTPLFSFSCLIALYAFGFRQTDSSCPDPLEAIIEVFTLVRGIRIIVRDGMQWLMQGPFAASMLPQPTNPNPRLAPKIEAVISALSQHNSELTMDPTLKGAYASGIGMLRQTFVLAAENQTAKMTVLPFPILVSDEFMEKLKERDPMALVILANYAVVLYWLRSFIWLRTWGKEIVDAVKRMVASEWHVYLNWAIEEVG